MASEHDLNRAHMESQMQDVWRIRRLQYLRDTRLPVLCEKIKGYFEPKKIAARRINNFFIKHYFHEVINIGDLINIPGRFRFRVHLSNKNLIENKKDNVTDNSIESQSVRQLEIDEKAQLDKAFIESLRTCDDIDDEDLAVIMSLNQYEEQYENQDLGFYYVLDLRLIGHNPEQPIEIFGSKYFLDGQQKDKVRRLWHLVDPATSSGLIFEQNIISQKGLIKDMMT